MYAKMIVSKLPQRTSEFVFFSLSDYIVAIFSVHLADLTKWLYTVHILIYLNSIPCNSYITRPTCSAHSNHLIEITHKI